MKYQGGTNRNVNRNHMSILISANLLSLEVEAEMVSSHSFIGRAKDVSLRLWHRSWFLEINHTMQGELQVLCSRTCGTRNLWWFLRLLMTESSYHFHSLACKCKGEA